MTNEDREAYRAGWRRIFLKKGFAKLVDDFKKWFLKLIGRETPTRGKFYYNVKTGRWDTTRPVRTRQPFLIAVSQPNGPRSRVQVQTKNGTIETHEFGRKMYIGQH